MKPLGTKAYGSIPHLPFSKLGPGDHHITLGQAKIMTEKARDKNDVIIVQEKLDGSCVAVAKDGNGNIIALTRSGYLASESPYLQHHMFAQWVKKNEDNFHGILHKKERAVGEWMAMAHGTKYDLPHEPFVLFDIMWGTDRRNLGYVQQVVQGAFPMPKVWHVGGPIKIDQLPDYSWHGAEKPEGFIYRVERNGRVDFLAKWVRPDYEPGKYFKEKTGYDTWNIKPEKETTNP